jgi:hypothetical protein
MYTLSDTATLSRPFALVVKKNEDPGLSRIPVLSVPSFPIAKLNGKFLNPRTRAEQLEAFQVYIFR